MPTSSKPLPTEEEILARFHRLRITIGLSQTKFGYVAVGNPAIVGRMTSGHRLHPKTRERLAYALDELEKGHSVPIPATVNKTRTKVDEEKSPTVGIVSNRSEMED